MSEWRFPDEANLRSPAYFIAMAWTPCERCGRSIQVLALALPAGHETLLVDEDPLKADTADVWQCADTLCFLFQVSFLCPAVQSRLRGISSHYRSQSGAQGELWLNRCEHCGAMQSDDTLHCEPGGAFLPESAAQAAAVELLECREGFEAAAAGYSFELEYLGFMRRI